MSKKMLSMLAAFALAAAVTTAEACPGGSGCKCGAKTKTVADSAPNSAKAKTVADKATTPCSKSANTPCHKGGAKLVSDKAGCPIAARLAKLPKIQYKIGEDVTDCSKSAAKMAEESKTKMVYLVGDKSFDKEGEAKVALTTALEAEIANLTAMQFAVGSDCVRCPITAKSMAKKAGTKVAYRVGGMDFADKDKAEKAVVLVTDASDAVKMTYKVAGKSFSCDKMAGARVEETGKEMTFVVGDEETSCPTTAKLMLTKAKVHAIIAAAAAALAL